MGSVFNRGLRANLKEIRQSVAALPNWTRRLGYYGLGLVVCGGSGNAALGTAGCAEPRADSGILSVMGWGRSVRRPGTGTAGNGGFLAMH